jgi:hypothetical protein
MGLDMYLDKETYVKNWGFQKLEEKYTVTVEKGGKVLKDIDSTKVKYIVEEVGYWRKANAIHNWFVQNIQDGVDNCQRSYVSREELQRLLKLVERVIENNSLASELLPTQSGFFFGGTEYDEWYFKDLEDTKKILTEALSYPPDSDFYYYASW